MEKKHRMNILSVANPVNYERRTILILSFCVDNNEQQV